MTFEDKIINLEENIKDLSCGKIPLSKAIDKYSESLKILNECREELKSFKLEIELLEEENGNN